MVTKLKPKSLGRSLNLGSSKEKMSVFKIEMEGRGRVGVASVLTRGVDFPKFQKNC